MSGLFGRLGRDAKPKSPDPLDTAALSPTGESPSHLLLDSGRRAHTPPASSPPEDLDEQLHAALTRKATHWLRLLEREDRDSEGNPIYDLRTQMEVFKLASDWLSKSRRMSPDKDNEANPEAIEMLKALMKAPQVQKAVAEVVDPDKPKRGRPTNAQLAEKKRKADAKAKAVAQDDSQLKKLLAGGKP